MNRSTGVLLGLLGLLAGVLGTLGVQQLRGEEPGEVMLEDIPGYESAHVQAGYYCTLGGAVPGMRGLHDPAYIQCVEDQTRGKLVTKGHPEAETAESRLD